MLTFIHLSLSYQSTSLYRTALTTGSRGDLCLRLCRLLYNKPPLTATRLLLGHGQRWLEIDPNIILSQKNLSCYLLATYLVAIRNRGSKFGDYTLCLKKTRHPIVNILKIGRDLTKLSSQ